MVKKMSWVTYGDGDVEPAFGLFGGKMGTLNKIKIEKAQTDYGAVIDPVTLEINRQSTTELRSSRRNGR